MEKTGTKTRLDLRLVNLFLFIVLLYIAQSIIVPLLYGCFVAIILYPLCSKLEALGWKRWVAIFTGLFIVSLLITALIVIILYQYNLFKQDLPLLLLKLKPVLASASGWLSQTLGLHFNESDSFLQNLVKYSGNNIGSWISSGINGTFNLFFNIIIIPIYAALILNFRKRIVLFLVSLTGEQNKERVIDILSKTIKSYGNYIKGMVWVYLIVGILNSIGLLIVGVKYAVLFGMITAVMTIIPYFGIIISSLLPISMAWISTNSLYYPLGVICVFSIVQYLEGNFIFPYVVGKKVNVNILVSLISVFAGGLLWGVSGMVLFLPLVAVLKIVADELEGWESLRILLGDENELNHKITT